ncbi:beta-L-arabinofuranosidase domain-containing protein [Paenibacillus sp. JJ-223]|uniref:glycoside hydrolase family 127 protein n=1 Tax=Paenibacillus sp. JJ-223 TaxID=2905647 RepID=UPI001F2860ED|nr:beta-L-arabinofuranosidase domain-containing protein [Paenibacillus sp. JJ-223]CAH1210395.1 Non-reducing end beta-L-arabinofuranosidase [Paenibacillus sp. JJ-223]
MQTTQVHIRDQFWEGYSALVRQTVIPYQWEALNDRIEGAEPSYAIRNFRIAAGLEQGEFGGWVFQDSDLYKWLEAVAYSLRSHPDPDLENIADEAIDLIGQAQRDNGYINTYFTIKEPGKEWTNLYEAHELYCAGHLIEAAVAYAEATGKRKLLDIACRFADLIDTLFGTGENQMRAYCGHQEIELALVKLYHATGEQRYLKLSQYFIDERGSSPSYFVQEWERRGRTGLWSQGSPNLEMYQSHLPVREQTAAVGHSVRAVYMYTAMADLARLTRDDSLRAACERLWANTTRKQMYITGGVGATHLGEAFTFDYDLPNDAVYAETCASIGLIFWARRMLRLEAKSEYADVMERALYNNVLGSMSKDGKHFFYVNPLEVWPEASKRNPDKHHVKPVRQKWFGCSCCPPNVARLLSSLNDYIYDVSAEENAVHVHLYIGSTVQFTSAEGREVTLRQHSELPWNGKVDFNVSLAPGSADGTDFTLALRIPNWFQSGKPVLRVNGEVQAYMVNNGYAHIRRLWSEGDALEWLLPMETQLIEAHPQIRADAGKAAIQRGPLVYCVEEADNGAPLASLSIAEAANLTEREAPHLLGGCVVVEGDGLTADASAWPEDQPYLPIRKPRTPVRFTAIPYYLWGNREPGEMSVWLRH